MFTMKETKPQGATKPIHARREIPVKARLEIQKAINEIRQGVYLIDDVSK